MLVHKIVPDLTKVNCGSVRIHSVFSDPKEKIGNVDFSKKTLRKSMLNPIGAARKKAGVFNPIDAAEVKRLNESAFNDVWNVHVNRHENLVGMNLLEGKEKISSRMRMNMVP